MTAPDISILGVAYFLLISRTFAKFWLIKFLSRVMTLFLPYLNMFGNRVLIPYKVDKTTMTTTIVVVMVFCQSVFVYSPMVFLLFKSRIRKTRAAGRSVTAMTCTNRVINTSGALGMRTMRPAVIRVKK